MTLAECNLQRARLENDAISFPLSVCLQIDASKSSKYWCVCVCVCINEMKKKKRGGHHRDSMKRMNVETGLHYGRDTSFLKSHTAHTYGAHWS